ncbi:MAG: hypothetical protein JWQ90_5397 [Hydrocarboniphaga sp.]|uniref:Mpo1 family 2-hydroxy fatty acid dioxygenase n=1 Tax=Hydrocarboniphaga sp. TaxID=2033016 RepID=UPI0026328F18|nr:Mpo1-like protein [Hydrocarboniphaga sp.]MDB5972947.1 hypothetical protein [Hydrocarboniphaga sp.]
MKTVEQWLGEYSSSHRNLKNKTLHWICVPQIVFAVFLALKCIPLGSALVNAESVVIALSLAYYLRLSWRLTVGLALVYVPMYLVTVLLQQLAGPYTIWIAAAIFIEAWIGQFIGHHYEGSRPSFFKDLQFLMIGPLWLMSFLYQKWDIPLAAKTA